MEQVHPPVSRVLIVAAHPDDIEFGAGGTAAVWSDEGIEVTYLIVTDGAAGSNEPGVDYVKLIERRRDEQTRAAACVGVTDVRFLGYADGTLTPTMELRRDVTRVIRELRPDRVVIMDPTVVLLSEGEFNYINHPDHRAAGEAALYAVFPSAETRPIFPELLDEGFEPHHVNELWLMLGDKANRYIDITTVHERKIAALLCHESQLGEEVAGFIRQFDGMTGVQAGYQYAEQFRVMTFYPTPTPQPQDLETSAS
jgi:LmbE family N-acetylglucosaminyl deacetylase